MSKMKRVAISVMVYVVLTVTTLLSILYIRDFRYSSERGVYKILSRYEDIPEERREYYSKDYEFVVAHLDLGGIIAMF